jgi:hypothetical protein
MRPNLEREKGAEAVSDAAALDTEDSSEDEDFVIATDEGIFIKLSSKLRVKNSLTVTL